MTKDQVVSVIDKFPEDGVHKVDLDNPDVCINVEVSPLFCGVAFLKNWAHHKKYNVTAVMNPEAHQKDVDMQKKQNQDKKKEEKKKAADDEKKEEAPKSLEEKKEEPAKAEEKKESVAAEETDAATPEKAAA